MKNTYLLIKLISVIVFIQSDVGLFVISNDLVTVYRDKESDRFILPQGFNCSDVPGVLSAKMSNGKSSTSDSDESKQLCYCNTTISPILHFKVDWKTRNAIIGCYHHDSICPGNTFFIKISQVISFYDCDDNLGLGTLYLLFIGR